MNPINIKDLSLNAIEELSKLEKKRIDLDWLANQLSYEDKPTDH